VFGNYPVRKYIQSSGCFFSAAGYRYIDYGALGEVGIQGTFYSSSPSVASAYRMEVKSGNVYPGTNTAPRTFATPIRCVKEFISVCDQTVQKDET
jgi:hypothetical protein